MSGWRRPTKHGLDKCSSNLQPPTREAANARSRRLEQGALHTHNLLRLARISRAPTREQRRPTRPHTGPYGARPLTALRIWPEATLAARTYGPQGCIIVRHTRPCHSPRARTVSVAPPRPGANSEPSPHGQAGQEPRAVIRRPDACQPDIAPGALAPLRFSRPAFEGKVQWTPEEKVGLREVPRRARRNV